MDNKVINEKASLISKKELSILVVSYDGAQELWSPFAQAWNRNWHDCTWEKILITQEINSVQGNCFDRVISIPSVASKVMFRVKEALNEIDSKYILVMCDDYFLYDAPDTNKISNIIEMMKMQKISCVHLDNKGKDTDEIKTEEIRNKSFLVSGGIPSIYEKEFIYMLCDKFSDCTMREWELNASRWLKDKEYEIINVKNSSFRCHHCVLEGYWRLKPYLWTKRNKINVCYNVYKKPTFCHSIYAVCKAICFNMVLYCFPRLYAGWTKRKYTGHKVAK